MEFLFFLFLLMRKAPYVLKKTAAQTELTVRKKKKKERKVACCFPGGWELCFPTPEWLLEFSFQPYPHRLPMRWKQTATGTASQRLWAGLYVSTIRRRAGIDLPLWRLPNTPPGLVVMVTRAMLVQVSYCDRDTCDSNEGNERGSAVLPRLQQEGSGDCGAPSSG